MGEYHEDLARMLDDNDRKGLLNLIENLANAAMAAMCEVIQDPDLRRHCTADEILMGYAAQKVSDFYQHKIREDLRDSPKMRREAQAFAKQIVAMMKAERKKREKKKT